MKQIRYWTVAAIIAALYAALTALSSVLGLSIGIFELRFSEALCILPVFTPAAVPGLFGGCLLSSLLLGANVFDVILGSLATLLGALGTLALRERGFLAFLPPLFWNTLLVPPVLYFAYGLTALPYPLLLLSFLGGEALSAGGLGFLLKKGLWPYREKIK
ncbi:MAG: QueT transporter family protein [Clostridia bacterium]|nr:QueT transporter family protein [Clostridia bacterium]